MIISFLDPVNIFIRSLFGGHTVTPTFDLVDLAIEATDLDLVKNVLKTKCVF